MRVRRKLRSLLEGDGIIVAPGACNAFTAKLIERLGFEVAYLTGSGVSYSVLGAPDLGLISQHEMVQQVSYISGAVNVPLICDADTGYGNALNVIRTIKEYEKAGASAIQIEDQTFPKRCGHLEGKEVISADEMTLKIKASVETRDDPDLLIVARTDALSMFGLEDALKRASIYENAGADIIFIEAPTTLEEMTKITATLRVPAIANMVEGGRTPLLSVKELEEIGYKIVIYPNSVLRSQAKAALEVLSLLKEKGSTQDYVDNMVLFRELNKLLNLDEYYKLERRYLPKKLPHYNARSLM